jgi:hypothetical protein
VCAVSVDHRVRAENIRWFTETGESLSGAARRLGISTDGVEKWCQLHGMRAELERLRAREPYLPADRHEVNRRNAEVRWAS